MVDSMAGVSVSLILLNDFVMQKEAVSVLKANASLVLQRESERLLPLIDGKAGL